MLSDLRTAVSHLHYWFQIGAPYQSTSCQDNRSEAASTASALSIENTIMASRSPLRAIPRCSYTMCLTSGRFVDQASWLEDSASNACITKSYSRPRLKKLIYVLVIFCITDGPDWQRNLGFQNGNFHCIMCPWRYRGNEIWYVKFLGMKDFSFRWGGALLVSRWELCSVPQKLDVEFGF